MSNCLLKYTIALLGLCFLMTGETAAQSLRAEKTVFFKPRVGLSHYYGDSNESLNFGLGEGDEFPYVYGAELGYQFTPALSFGVAGQQANYPLLPLDNADHSRWTINALLRWTAMAERSRVAPFLEIGGHVSEGSVTDIDGDGDTGETNFGPSLGLGLDFALTPRLALQLELLSNVHIPGEGLDDNNGQVDVTSGLNLGLKFNFSGVTAPAVLALECPATLQTNQTGTFTASTNDATMPVTYTWNWGDGTSSPGRIGTRSYTRPGTYTVTFGAQNRGGSATERCVVNVVAPPAPAEIVTLSADRSRFKVCEPTTVSFSANVRGDSPLTYRWDFGDGTMGSGANPEHTYSRAGTYTVTLTASNSAGTATREMVVTAEPCEAAICREVTEMNAVFFERNASTLTGEARAALEENLAIFAECPNLCARIAGFAAPGERNPQGLSADRARAVEQFYINGRIPASRFTPEGRGRVGGTTSKKEGTSQFRRVDTIPMQCVGMN